MDRPVKPVGIEDALANYAEKGKKRPEKAATPKPSIWQREIEISPAFGDKEKRAFFQMLAVLLDSGLAITDAFEVLIEQEKKNKPKEILSGIAAELQTGAPLSQALAGWPKYFAPFERSAIRMAEDTGQLVRVLADLGSLFERRIRLRRKVTQALAYPLVVLFVAFGVVGFMLGFVVPMFQDIFDRFDAELPAITQTILSLSDFLLSRGWLLLVAIGLLVLAWFLIRKTDFWKRTTGTLLRKLPLIGPLNHKIQLSRLSYNLALMLQSGVSLDRALKLLGEVVNYHPLAAPLPEIHQSVSEGESLHAAVSRYPVYPVLLRQMIRVGEQTGRLPQMLERLAQNLEEEGENGVKTLTTLLEPVMILVIGLIVAVILVAMYLPMFELSNTISA